MRQKEIGIIMIIVSLFIALFVILVQVENEAFAQAYIKEKGTCFLDNGTCLHKKNLPLSIFGWSLSGALMVFGIFIGFIDKSHEVLQKHQKEISNALFMAKKEDREKSEFEAFLSGFGKDEQSILDIINKQEGIKQSTLRYKTGISKTQLSLTLKDFEKREIISREKSGKTKKVYLRKKF